MFENGMVVTEEAARRSLVQSLKFHPRKTYGGGGGAIRRDSEKQHWAQFPMKV